jgi:hypothetical protein
MTACAMLLRTCAGASALGWHSNTPSALIWHKPRSCLFTQHPIASIGVAARRGMASSAAGHHAAAEAEQQQLMHLLADAHAHPQLDPANMQRVKQLQCCHVAAMSVSYDVDWDIMLQLHQMAGVQPTTACCCCSSALHQYHKSSNHITEQLWTFDTTACATNACSACVTVQSFAGNPSPNHLPTSLHVPPCMPSQLSLPSHPSTVDVQTSLTCCCCVLQHRQQNHSRVWHPPLVVTPPCIQQRRQLAAAAGGSLAGTAAASHRHISTPRPRHKLGSIRNKQAREPS